MVLKLQKRISIWSGALSFISFILSAIFSIYGFSFLCSVFVGLFSSGILICFTAIITYFSERDKSVLSLYNGCYRFMKQLNQNLAPDGRVVLGDVKNNLSMMMDSYSVDIYYYVCELSGLWKRSKLYKIVMAIQEASRNIYLLVSEDNNQIMQFYLGDISQQDLLKYKFKYLGEESVESVKALEKALADLRYHMNYYNSKKEQQKG